MKTIILIGGKMRHGKDTLGAYVARQFREKGFSAEIQSFATPLKDKCSQAFGPIADDMNSKLDEIWNSVLETQNLSMPATESIYKKIIEMKTSSLNWYEKKNWFTRQVLQRVGTDVARWIDEDFWAKKSVDAIKNSKSDVIVFTDWRYESEESYLSEHGDDSWQMFTVIVHRNVKILESLGVDAHASENGLNNVIPTFEVENFGTLEELYNSGDTLIEEILELI